MPFKNRWPKSIEANSYAGVPVELVVIKPEGAPALEAQVKPLHS